MRYQKEFVVHSYETNRFGNASLSSIFNLLIEVAWEHAQKLDWGFDALKSNNYFWVLSRIYIKIEKYPRWQEKLTIDTWATGTDSIYAFREYAIKNEEGEVIIRASSAWLILDLESKRIVKPGTLTTSFQKLAQSETCRYPAKIKMPAQDKDLDFVPVVFTDLDINQHFNSVKYVERALNNFGICFLNKHEVSEIEINYLKEGLPEDSLAISSIAISENENLVSLVRETDKANLCTMKINWRAK